MYNYNYIYHHQAESWLNFRLDQTAFQKGKSTLIHIFNLKILIDLAKKLKIMLYIASVDIEKSFDHVPHSLRLKKLVKMGIGKVMLFALKLGPNAMLSLPRDGIRISQISLVERSVSSHTMMLRHSV